jgi:hypothetical protein
MDSESNSGRNDASFLIAFDLLDPALNYDGAVAYIRDCSDFRAWWNHVPGVFIVTTRLRPDEISERLRTFTKDSNLLVVQVDLENSDGRLSQKAWDWINKRSPAREPARV